LSSVVVADPVLGFLNLASDVHEAAVAIHNDRQDWDCDISRLFTTLTITVERLRGEISRGDDADFRVHTCVNLGKDLLLRLGRVKAFHESNGPHTDLRIVWPVTAVEALGDRIQVLYYRWSTST
jgi:hypothetical protein